MSHSLRAVPGRSEAPDDLTIGSLVDFLRSHRRLVLGSGLAAFLLVGVTTFVRPRSWTSTARFMPQTSEGALSRLSGLAATFGVAVPAAEAGSSPAFYSELLQSRDIIRGAVETRYAFTSGGDSLRGTLVELFDAEGATPGRRRDEAAKELRESIDVTVSRETGTVSLEVTTRWPELSQLVAQRMIALVSDFNLHRRQTKALAERRFVESRLADARDSLRAVESRLQGFLQRNREYRNSPQLAFDYDRLEREMLMQQQVYTGLAQSYEAARIDEVRNTPVITVVEPPDLPAKPDARLALVKGVLAGLVGMGLGAFFAAARPLLAGLLGWRGGRAAV